jgi:GntR family transcriptional regulator
MVFDGRQAIYLQIADHVCERILAGAWQAGERIPSVRELAEEIRVNPNTVIRSYAYLQELGIIHIQRGLGYFVSDTAAARTIELKRKDFVARTLPVVFRTMELIGMGWKDLKRFYDERAEAGGRQGRARTEEGSR